MNVTIKDIAYYLPEQVSTNEDLSKKYPTWDMNMVEERSGVVKRHIAGEDETSLDLAYEACKRLFAKHEDLSKQIDGIVFCTQSTDYIMPPNACILHKLLKLSDECYAHDFNLACSGYVYGLAMVRGLIATGVCSNVLLVNADTYSKYIYEGDRSVRVLFGDGAAVSWIAKADAPDEGIVDVACGTAGKGYDKFIIRAGGCRLPKSEETAKLIVKEGSTSVRTLDTIHMDGMGILVFVNSKVPKHIKKFLKKHDMKTNDVDLFVLHQASKMALNSLTKLLRVEPDKVYNGMREVGNTVSASIPIALKDAMDEGRIAKGDKVLLCGFGVGLSWGSALLIA